MALNFGQGLFAPRGEILTNYDYFDIADGIGYKIFYGAMGSNGEYIVTPNKIYSEKIKTARFGAIANVATKYFDVDFDLTFGVPKNVKGDLLINVPIGMGAGSTSPEDYEYYVIVTAYHYDGVTETSLGTDTSWTAAADNLDQTGIDYDSNVMLLRIPVATTKHFKSGEKLRFTVEGWFKGDGGGSAYTAIGHDPVDRDDSGKQESADAGGRILATGSTSTTYEYISTQMSFHVPFKIDI